MAVERPETHYVRTPDGVEIAYLEFGDGPRVIVWLPHYLFDIDLWWDCEPIARWLDGLASLGRVIIRDFRGTGPLAGRRLSLAAGRAALRSS